MIRKILALALLFAPGIARADWHEASSAHFRVYSEQPVERLRSFATELERFDKAIRMLRGDPDKPVGPANRVTIYVVDDTDAVQALIGRDGVAGFYVPRAGASMAIVPRFSGAARAEDLRPQTVLLHEYTHHLMFTMAPNAVYPLWYSEGFAELLAPTSFEKDGAVLIGNMPQYRAHSIMGANPLSVEKLLLSDPRDFDRAQMDALYGQGWLLTHYTMLGKARQDQLGAYLLAINRGKSRAEAAAAFGGLDTLSGELARYKVSRLKGLRVRADALATGPVTIRALTAGEAATMDLRIRSQNGVSAADAPALYAALQKAAAPYPDDTVAQTILAGAALDARDPVGAEAAAARALVVDPGNVGALVFQAKARMAAAVRDRDTRAASWEAVRAPLLAAIARDATDPRPCIAYYRSFAAAGQAPDKAAQDGLYTAFLAAPQDSGLRLLTAGMLLRGGEPRNARALLAPLVGAPHAGARGTQAAAILARIDAGDLAGAVALLDKSAG
ncbi:DUF1570 domain-containing protein [Sphingomonas sp. CJ20]